MQTTHANCNGLLHSSSTRRCIQVGKVFSTPHCFVQISSDGSPLLVDIQLPHILENSTHKTAHEKLLFLHHRLDLCTNTPLQSICSSISSSRMVWLVHPHFFTVCLLQTFALTIVYCSSNRHHRWTCLEMSSFIVGLVFSTLGLQLHWFVVATF